jgi:hypothetical protein
MWVRVWFRKIVPVVYPCGTLPAPQQPTDLSSLESFLGLTGHFQDLIQNYSRIAAPLTDLKRQNNILNNTGKATYQWEMHVHKLQGVWTIEHTKAFLKLKSALINEPVLKGPQFDRSPFIVTTDGSGQAFGGSLAQRFTTKLPSGKVVTWIHPVAFASK